MKPIRKMTESEVRDLKEYVRLDFYNNELKEAGVSASMSIDDDGDGCYELTVKEGDHNAPISCGLSEDELADEVIHVAYEMMRKRYVVTYVGLTDDDAFGNGYCEVEVCSERHIAERIAKEWSENEMEVQKDSKPTMEQNGDVRVISWAECQVIITIHEKLVKMV